MRGRAAGRRPSAPTIVSLQPRAAAGSANRSLAGVHACKLIPASVVARTLGQLSEPPSESPGGLDCFYSTQVPGGGGPSYELTVVTRSSYEAAKAVTQGAAKAGSIHIVSVSGIGDDAYATASSNGEPRYELNAAKGGAAINLGVNSLDQADEQRVHELVAVAIANL